MSKEHTYYVVKRDAMPEVLLKVVECKNLIESGKCKTVGEATEQLGISRSSFYKYKDDIVPFHDSSEGKTVTFTCEMEDEPGILSVMLKVIASYGANILTIHQSIPINNMASLSFSLQILPSTGDVSDMIEEMEKLKGVRNVKILAKE